MKPEKRISAFTAVYLIMVLAMFILPLFSLQDHSIIRNTLYELGSQGEPYAWRMNLIFILLATSSIITGWTYYDGFILHRIILSIFSISLALAALYNHSPLNPVMKYNITEAGLHEYFECTAIFSFITLSLATIFIMERKSERFLAASAGFSVIILSVLTSESDYLAGIWQRLLFIILFGWMIFIFKTPEY